MTKTLRLERLHRKIRMNCCKSERKEEQDGQLNRHALRHFLFAQADFCKRPIALLIFFKIGKQAEVEKTSGCRKKENRNKKADKQFQNKYWPLRQIEIGYWELFL